MFQSELYEKVYFQDNYKEELEALRSRFHGRARDALTGRRIDKAPVPNATTIVYLHDDPDGGVRITTGDFVEFFNKRYGGKDRIGAVRAALVNAERKADKSREYAKRARSEQAREDARSKRPRTAGRSLVVVNTLFALLLVFSLTVLSGTAVVMDRTDREIATMQAELASGEHGTAESVAAYNGAPEAPVNYLELSNENSVELYEAPYEESVVVSTIRQALAVLGIE